MRVKILGIPLQKQSMKVARIGNSVRSYQPKHIVDWCAQARLQIIEQLGGKTNLVSDPIRIKEIKFVFPPLKSWPKYKLKRLTDGVTIYKKVKPDWDNLCKNLMDVCNGILWYDDAQIVLIEKISKVHGMTPRIELEFEAIEEESIAHMVRSVADLIKGYCERCGEPIYQKPGIYPINICHRCIKRGE